MSRIKLLNNSIASRIAAGEVITNPAAVVKELAENAIDAGATAVTVEIKEGGREYIRVTDNGGGIHADDMELAVQKHATSKIAALQDLSAIATLGFRGEALASMAAVARLTLRSRAPGSVSGAILTVNGGGIPKTTPAGLPDGTTVEVENLFYNIPARRKFLKSAATEAARVAGVVSRLILAEPQVSFRYVNNGKTVYHSPGNGILPDALITVYGKDIAGKVTGVEMAAPTISVSGFISRPSVLYKNANHMLYFLNGRYIQSKQVTQALLRGYGERILKSHYPLAVLHIHLPFGLVDVNVHPNKLQVMFYDEPAVTDAIEQAIDRALQDNAPRTLDLQSAKQTEADLQYSEKTYIAADHIPNGFSQGSPAHAAQQVSSSAEALIHGDEYYSLARDKGFEQVMDGVLADSSDTAADAGEQTEIADVRAMVAYKTIGQAFDTYLICESGDALYLIDQHAAHERINYERMKARAAGGEAFAQQLLTPIVKKFSESDFNLLAQNMELLCRLGFEMEPFGNLTYKITALPIAVEKTNADQILDEVLFELKNQTKDIVLTRDKIIRAACRYSIKAGDRLSDAEIRALLEEITAMEAIPTCPHGRPIAVAITKSDLMKGFKRTL